MPENKRYQTSKPIIVIELKGGMVTDVNSTVPATIMVEDWDCPPAEPLVIAFESGRLTEEQENRVSDMAGREDESEERPL